MPTTGPALRSWRALATAGEAQAAGHAEDDGDADQDEGRGHDGQQEVLEGRLELVLPEAEGHQGVGGDGGHLEKDVDVEKVRGQDEAVHPGDHDQEQGVIIRLGPVVLHVVDREQADAKPDQGDGHEHEQAEPVEGQAEVDGLPEPGQLLEGGSVPDERPADGHGVDEQEEKGRVGQQVRHDPPGDLADERQDSRHDERQGNEENDQRSSSIFTNSSERSMESIGYFVSMEMTPATMMRPARHQAR